jgi:hypothetical protein
MCRKLIVAASSRAAVQKKSIRTVRRSDAKVQFAAPFHHAPTNRRCKLADRDREWAVRPSVERPGLQQFDEAGEPGVGLVAVDDAVIDS